MARKKTTPKPAAKPRRTAKKKTTPKPATMPRRAAKPKTAPPRAERTSRVTVSARKKATPGGGGVAAWEDDPASGFSPVITSSVPAPEKGKLAVRISHPPAAPKPGIYKAGTSEFRYWAAAEALDRARTFWAPLLAGKTWHTGAELPADLDAGVDLNAYYDRQGLKFFHETVQGTTYYAGESPDILCHELGHAVLDVLRPDLWNTASDEAAAFHESFGDMSALLTALQLKSVRVEVLQVTGGKIGRSSRLSRLAEQLGAAIRLVRADAAEPDCLRNAANSFFYRNPLDLPPVGPAATLSSEPHSFSRVFTGAFFDALAGALAVVGSASPTEDQLEATALALAGLLVQGVQAAALVPDFMSQVAASMVAADAQTNQGRFSDVLKSAFVRRGLLSLDTAAAPTGPGVSRSMALSATAEPAAAALRLSGAVFGLPEELELEVQAPGAARRFMAQAASFGPGPATAPDLDRAAQGYVADLFRRGRVHLPPAGQRRDGIANPIATKTHELERDGRTLRLVRLRFDCGFDCARF
jgi:hypothetical protein